MEQMKSLILTTLLTALLSAPIPTGAMNSHMKVDEDAASGSTSEPRNQGDPEADVLPLGSPFLRTFDGQQAYLLQDTRFLAARSENFSFAANLSTGEACARFMVAPEETINSLFDKVPGGTVDAFFPPVEMTDPSPETIWTVALPKNTQRALAESIAPLLALARCLARHTASMHPATVFATSLSHAPGRVAAHKFICSASLMCLLVPATPHNVIWRKKTSTGTWHAELLTYSPKRISLTLGSAARFPVGAEGAMVEFQRPQVSYSFNPGGPEGVWTVADLHDRSTEKEYPNPPLAIQTLATVVLPVLQVNAAARRK